MDTTILIITVFEVQLLICHSCNAFSIVFSSPCQAKKVGMLTIQILSPVTINKPSSFPEVAWLKQNLILLQVFSIADRNVYT